MNLKQIFLEALEKANTDNSIESGIFDISKQEHIEILRGHLLESNVDSKTVNQYLNKMLEGRYPDRQAYNANGILVTFPTPEYKQKAIERGSHFEQNPKKGQANVFSGDEQPEQPSGQQIEFEPTQPQQIQQTQQQEPQTPKSDDRTPDEKEQDAVAIEKSLTTEYTLEEALKYGFYNKKNKWYDSSGDFIGNLWNVNGKQLILNK
tara:strand:- start:1713 stop:2330 length:618 start_codon:yes stop_codon:yes gene_type:complete